MGGVAHAMGQFRELDALRCARYGVPFCEFFFVLSICARRHFQLHRPPVESWMLAKHDSRKCRKRSQIVRGIGSLTFLMRHPSTWKDDIHRET